MPGAKLCVGCGGPRDKGEGQANCRACHATYMRGWRAGRRAADADYTAVAVKAVQRAIAADIDFGWWLACVLNAANRNPETGIGRVS